LRSRAFDVLNEISVLLYERKARKMEFLEWGMHD
jgi:hypothetical protein